MTMYERIMSGKLFTDMCEGLPEQRLQGKLRMKQFNDSSPADFAGREEMMREMFGQGEKIWVEPPFILCMESTFLSGWFEAAPPGPARGSWTACAAAGSR